MSSFIDSLSKFIFNSAVVVYKQPLTARTWHIRIQGQALDGYVHTPGDHIRLFVGIDREKGIENKLRTYSVWNHDAKVGSVDITICAHSSGGIMAGWLNDIKVGNTIHYMGPKGKLTVENGDSHFLVGDLSALSHLYAIRRGVAKGSKVLGVVYGEDEAECFADIDGQKPFTFLKLPDNPVGELISYFEEHTQENPGHTVIYLGGDARVCKSLGRYFRNDAGWNGATVKVKGFWMPGKVGMD